MENTKTSTLGKYLIIYGCLWFVCALSQLPPLVILLSMFSISDVFLVTRIWPLEFPLAAIVVSVGILLRRRARHKLRAVDYLVVVGGASILVVIVLDIYDWIHFPHWMR